MELLLAKVGRIWDTYWSSNTFARYLNLVYWQKMRIVGWINTRRLAIKFDNLNADSHYTCLPISSDKCALISRVSTW